MRKFINDSFDLKSYGVSCDFEDFKKRGYFDNYEDNTFYSFLRCLYENAYNVSLSKIELILKNIELVKSIDYWGDADLYFHLLNDDTDSITFYLSFSPSNISATVECQLKNSDTKSVISIISNDFPFLEESKNLLLKLESLTTLNYLLSWITDDLLNPSNVDNLYIN